MTVLADSWLRWDSVSDSRDSTESEKNAAPDDDPPRGVASPAADAAAAITVAVAVWLAVEAAWFVGGAWQTAACWLWKASKTCFQVGKLVEEFDSPGGIQMGSGKNSIMGARENSRVTSDHQTRYTEIIVQQSTQPWKSPDWMTQVTAP